MVDIDRYFYCHFYCHSLHLPLEFDLHRDNFCSANVSTMILYKLLLPELYIIRSRKSIDRAPAKGQAQHWSRMRSLPCPQEVHCLWVKRICRPIIWGQK